METYGEWKKPTRRYNVTYIPQDTDNLFGSNPTTNINGMNFYGLNLNQLRGSTSSWAG